MGTERPGSQRRAMVWTSHGMIDCGQAEAMISRRVDGELSAFDAPQLDSHLKSCPHCRARLLNWSEQSALLAEELNGLWESDGQKSTPLQALNPRHTLAPIPIARSKRAQKTCLWVPIGMAASQVLAFAGLFIFLVFISRPVESPRIGLLRNSEIEIPAKAEEPAKSENTLFIPIPSARDVARAASPPSLQERPIFAAREPAAQNNLGNVLTPMAIPKIVTRDSGFAEMRGDEELLPKEIPNVSLEYKLDASADGNLRPRSGRVAILGDPLGKHCVVRITSEDGAVVQIACSDLGTALDPALRIVVQRLLAECSRPEWHDRLAASLR